MKPSYTPPWIFGLTNLPFGVAGTYAGVAMPYLLRAAGVSVETITALAALAFVPAAYQLFWAPILDLGIRRRTWLVLCATSGSLCLGATLLVEIPAQLMAYEILLVAGQALVGLVASCNGALVATTVDPRLLGRAAGWVNAANLGAAVLGGGLVLTLANRVSAPAAAVALVLAISLPSLAALWIGEPPPQRDKLARHVARTARDVWTAVRSRRGWTGLVFCISPVGTAALTNLFSALGNEYGVSNRVIEWVNGYAGGAVTACGALASGYLLDRLRERRHLFLAAGLSLALCAGGMGLAPLSPATYVVGCLAYLFVAGMAFAAFSAVVYEIVRAAEGTASTLYSVYPAAGNQAIAYTLLLDGAAQHLWGTRGLLWADAALNLGGVLALSLFLRVVLQKRTDVEPAADAPTREASAVEIAIR
ncbi:MAG TPA: MFS transporter [Pirellulales bacterium]|jgi:MFS family permease|nr:MFS transporter [Pirellulales bacterium]